MFSLRLPLILASVTGLCFSCAKPKKEKPELSLLVSEKLREIFPELKARYNQAETQELFKKLTKDSEPVCQVLHKKVPGNIYGFKKFSPLLWTQKYNTYLSEIIAGCYNFFTMNDLAVAHAFTKVRNFYPERKDCYSVGFAQLYFMHTYMNCNKWVAIDIDWRILDLQYQVLSRFFEGKPLVFKDLAVRWSANFGDEEKIRPREEGITVDSFCYWPTRPACRQVFKRFPIFFRTLGEIEMQLSFLHDIQLKPISGTSVIHVSNAVDPGYTSKAQFEVMMKSLMSVPDKKHKTVIVYHSGGSFQYAIYEVTRGEAGEPVVLKKCRDHLAWSKYYKDRPGVPYRTHFDNASKNNAPVCSGAGWSGS